MIIKWIFRILGGVVWIAGNVLAMMAANHGGPIAATFPAFILFAAVGGVAVAGSFD